MPSSGNTIKKMTLNTNQIEACIAWLRSNGSPAVRYLTNRTFSPSPGGPDVAANLWSDVQDCPEAKEIFSKQKADGSWYSGGSWALKPSYAQKSKPGGYDPESPKYVTTIWVLPLLGDMGFTAEDERIRKACEYILSFQAKGMTVNYQIFNDPEFYPDYDEFVPCRFAQHLVALGKVGFQDGRVRKGFKALLGSQQADGGWVSPFHFRKYKWTRSCPVSTAWATQALHSASQPDYKKALRRALKFLVWHLGTKQAPEVQRFYYHGHGAIHELIMFSEYAVGLKEKNVLATLEWIMAMYCPDQGCFKYAGKPISKFSRRIDGMDPRVAKYRLYHLIEDDWLTYYGTKICANLVKI